MNYLFVLHDSPYGTERTYNGLRWARHMLRKGDQHEVRVFLFGDAVVSVHSEQQTPNGYYNVGKMLQDLAEHGATSVPAEAAWTHAGSPRTGWSRAATARRWIELSEWTDWADRPINV